MPSPRPRSRWHAHGGIVAYVLVYLYGASLIALPQFVWDIAALRIGLVLLSLVLGIVAIYNLIAINKEHPSDALWSTLAGGLMIILFGLVFLAGGMFIVDEVPEDVGLGIVGALLIAGGLKVARRGWQLHSGPVACCVIVLGGLMCVTPLLAGLPWRTAWPLMLNRAEPALLLVVTGCFIIYDRRRAAS